jgi:hypothetical protein
MANDISTNSHVNEQFHPAESNETPEKSHNDDDSGTQVDPMPH